MTPIQRYGNAREFISQGLRVQAYPVQLQIISELFGEVCWCCTDEKYKETFWERHDIENNIVFMRYGKCPKCGSLRSYLARKGLDKFAAQGTYLVGQRGGSTLMAAMASLYAEHWMLTNKISPRISENMDDLPSPVNEITQLLVGPSLESIRALWETRQMLISGSPWYSLHDDWYLRNGNVIKTDWLWRNYAAVGVSAQAVAAGDMRPRGRMSYFSIVSEVAWMENAEETLLALNTATMTLHETALKNLDALGTEFNPCVMSISARKDSHDLLFDIWCKVGIDVPGYGRVIAKVIPSWNMNPSMNKAVLLRNHGDDANIVMRNFGCQCDGDSKQAVEIARKALYRLL